MKRILAILLLIFFINKAEAQLTGDAATRDNAGLQGDAGALSGFFQTSNPINFPTGATSYWHLLDIRHTNPANNFSMQFAGSFYDQYVYVRKTINNPAQPWSRIVTESAGGLIDVNSMAEGDILRNVFARMGEGNWRGDGTYLGVKAYGTQSTFGGKSFSIEHHFYGEVNSAINFHRGAGFIGGYMTFATNDGTEKMRIDNNGYVGIGNTSPQYKLDINAIDYKHLRMTGGIPMIKFAGDEYNSNNGGEIYQRTDGTMLFNTNSNTNGFVLTANGKMGIGTVTPSELLSVNGNIRSRKVIVTQTGWPDYVFDSSYQLPSLDSVSNFIQVNKHLPDMPSVAIVEKDGHDLGEVQKLLLKKVEELTLYILKQEEKIKEQGNKIEALERKLTNTSK